MTTPIRFKTLLQEAKAKGCVNIKVQFCENWKEVTSGLTVLEKQELFPSDEFFNMVKIKTRVNKSEVVSFILVRTDRDTLIIRVSLCEKHALLENFK